MVKKIFHLAPERKNLHLMDLTILGFFLLNHYDGQYFFFFWSLVDFFFCFFVVFFFFFFWFLPHFNLHKICQMQTVDMFPKKALEALKDIR
jgi:hypothetical protein